MDNPPQLSQYCFYVSQNGNCLVSNFTIKSNFHINMIFHKTDWIDSRTTLDTWDSIPCEDKTSIEQDRYNFLPLKYFLFFIAFFAGAWCLVLFHCSLLLYSRELCSMIWLVCSRIASKEFLTFSVQKCFFHQKNQVSQKRTIIRINSAFCKAVSCDFLVEKVGKYLSIYLLATL